MEMEMEIEMKMIRGLEMEWRDRMGRSESERRAAKKEGRREKGEWRTKKGKDVMMEFSQPRDHPDGFS